MLQVSDCTLTTEKTAQQRFRLRDSLVRIYCSCIASPAAGGVRTAVCKTRVRLPGGPSSQYRTRRAAATYEGNAEVWEISTWTGCRGRRRIGSLGVARHDGNTNTDGSQLHHLLYLRQGRTLSLVASPWLSRTNTIASCPICAQRLN